MGGKVTIQIIYERHISLHKWIFNLLSGTVEKAGTSRPNLAGVSGNEVIASTNPISTSEPILRDLFKMRLNFSEYTREKKGKNI